MGTWEWLTFMGRTRLQREQRCGTHRFLETVDLSIPWTIGGDHNFVERRKDKKGGLDCVHAEEYLDGDSRHGACSR